MQMSNSCTECDCVVVCTCTVHMCVYFRGDSANYFIPSTFSAMFQVDQRVRTWRADLRGPAGPRSRGPSSTPRCPGTAGRLWPPRRLQPGTGLQGTTCSHSGAVVVGTLNERRRLWLKHPAADHLLFQTKTIANPILKYQLWEMKCSRFCEPMFFILFIYFGGWGVDSWEVFMGTTNYDLTKWYYQKVYYQKDMWVYICL